MDMMEQHQWTDRWNNAKKNVVLDLRSTKIRDFVDIKIHLLLKYIISNYCNGEKLKVLEVGCANSKWLPYFNQQYGFEICGIDYSLKGCELERKILEDNGVQGEILCRDLFDENHELVNKFDVVFSFGVIEHYAEMQIAIKALVKYLKNDGVLISIIPNLCGIPGILQKLLNKKVYDEHVVVNCEEFQYHHTKSGLKVVEANYYIFSNIGMLNMENLRNTKLNFIRKSIVAGGLMLTGIEMKLKRLKAGRLLSPYIFAVGKKNNDNTLKENRNEKGSNH